MSDVTFSFDTPKHTPVDIASIQAAIDAEIGTPAGEIATAAAAAAAPAPAAQPAPAPIKQPAQTDTTPSAQAPAAQAAAPQTTSLEDLKTYNIVVDGQELTVTEADLKSGHMRLRDYTQKTQQVAAERAALAREREEWQRTLQQRDADLAQIDQFLRDQAAVDAYRQRAFGVQQAPIVVPQTDPNKPMTPEDAVQIARYNAEQVRLENQRQIEELRRQQALSTRALVESQKDIERGKLADQIHTHIETIIAKNPLLQRFEGIEDELIGMAAKYQPTSLDAAKERLQEAAERKLAVIKSIVEEQKKAVAIDAARLKQTSTEPSGGTVPKAQPPTKRLTMDVKDRNTRLQENEAFMRELMQASS